MGEHYQAPQHYVKVTFECSEEERVYIKMLAARERKTISELVLSYMRPDFPHEPNQETQKAILDSRGKKNLEHAKSTDDFWEQMGVKPKKHA
ncbi:MAG: hypothetical protein JSR37_07050 [Verrucomicrobia bacterium]|nr:hypothetical protein [Verrucomicrobiota bacterium]MBS0636065.1 hypothetical protein [Verrucomicrobiota bacterium]